MKRIHSDKDVNGLRKMYDEIETHVRSLQNLGVTGELGSVLAPIVLERLPDEFKRTVSRALKSDLSDLTKLLNLFSDELRV